MTQGDSWAPACAKCGRTPPGKCRDVQTGCFKCGQESHFMRECPKNRQGGNPGNRAQSLVSPKNRQGGNPGNRAQSSSFDPPDRAAPRRSTYGTGGGANRLYAITSRQEQENSLDVVTGMIKVFNFDVYALLDPGPSLYYVTPYVANQLSIGSIAYVEEEKRDLAKHVHRLARLRV
ncbi:uncharacterized protein LOC107027566 [Solanum pennellii]|uniref:Uncharacterized protein LOC107027566 n=1 Tax=Solanum pennellii TaxID=28526 RepID=A0ABM1HE43_SOLPN|nr:uncharacterized protein LOC107027566 [Solanum pennellii]